MANNGASAPKITSGKNFVNEAMLSIRAEAINSR
jgi:hypothetical protein